MLKRRNKPIALSLVVAAFILIQASVLYAETRITGKVISISDGDTITVLQNRQQFKIRLYGIDTPEKEQDFGSKAKAFTSDLLYNKEVTVIQKDVDRYGRVVGMVYIGNTNINEAIVKAGFAWVYEAYCKDPFCGDWIELEQQARKNGIGLWAHPDPEPPWKFRKNEQVEPQPVITKGDVYHGNMNSRVFHQASCKDFKCKNCTAFFRYREEALKAGYRPCGVCKP